MTTSERREWSSRATQVSALIIGFAVTFVVVGSILAVLNLRLELEELRSKSLLGRPCPENLR